MSAQSHPFEVRHRDVWAIAVPASVAFITEPLAGVIDTAVIGQLGDAGLLGGLSLGAVAFSVIFALCNIIGCYSLGLALALLMQQDFPGRGVFRVLLLLPWIVPSLVAVVSWRWMVQDEGALFNQIIGFFGGSPIFFLSDSTWAVVIVILIKIIHGRS